MNHKQLYQPFELYVSDMESWNEHPLVYHFFEIVQILEGSGMRTTNSNDYAYKKGSIFLFTPLDCRGFDIKTKTRFCSIRFSEVFLGQFKTAQDQERITRWLKQLEHIFSHHNRFQEVLIKQPGDCNMITSLMNNMVEEYEFKQAYHEENLQHFVTLILNIIARNVSESTPADNFAMTTTGLESEPLINRMLVHIGQYISSPEKLRVEFLAARFNLSANYVSEYFRKFAGESLRNYITNYKIRLVQQRLTFSTFTISQIANELGFTDESHLSRQFKKYNGVGPAEFRKRVKQGY